MNVLNLDALTKVERSITLNGKTHEVTEMTVEGFIAANEEAKKLRGVTADDVRQNMEATIAHIRRVVPTLEADEIRSMKITPLMALIEFINSAVEAEEQKGADAAGK